MTESADGTPIRKDGEFVEGPSVKPSQEIKSHQYAHQHFVKIFHFFPSIPGEAYMPEKPRIRRCVHTTWLTGHSRSTFRIPKSSSKTVYDRISQLLTQLPTLSLNDDCCCGIQRFARKHTLIRKVFHRPALVFTRF